MNSDVASSTNPRVALTPIMVSLLALVALAAVWGGFIWVFLGRDPAGWAPWSLAATGAFGAGAAHLLPRRSAPFLRETTLITFGLAAALAVLLSLLIWGS